MSIGTESPVLAERLHEIEDVLGVGKDGAKNVEVVIATVWGTVGDLHRAFVDETEQSADWTPKVVG